MSGDYNYTFSFSSSEPYDATIMGVDFASGTEKTAIIPSKKFNPNTGTYVDVVSIHEFTFDGRPLTTLIFQNPDTSNLTSIGFGAVRNCSNLTSVTFPDSLVSIGGEAFAECSKLASVTFPDSLVSIGEKAFKSCFELTSITFPESLTSIGDEAFRSCSKLASITFPDSLTSIGTSAFESCSNLETITFPESLTSISNQAFYSCSNLTSITFSETLTSIGDAAFGTCSILETIALPETLTSIGTSAFVSCSSLETIALPESLTSIGTNAFTNCSNLKTITWYDPKNLTSIGDFIFQSANSIETVTYYNATSTHPNVRNLNTMADNGTYSSATKIYAGPYPIPPPARCFKDGTYILCKTIQNDQERLEQIKVQDLKVGTLVKTKYDGFKPIVKIISSVIKNNPNYKDGTNPYNKDQLYTCSVNRFDDLFEDLIITGSHSILVFPITDKQKEDICGLLGELYVTDHKYRLPACLDERCVVYPEEGDFTIYHFALEKDCKLSNYGVFANGLLVETASIFDLEGR